MIDQIAHLVAKVRRPDTVAMGVGVPCAVDGPRGIVRDIPALPGWVDVPLAGLLQRRIGLPVAIENDAKAATIAEWRHGAAQGETDFVYVTVSTGIGAGAVIGGRLLRGAGGLAGELGHTRIADDTPLCSCGRIGCWQALASGTALEQRAEDQVRVEPESILATLASGSPPTGAHVHAAALRDCRIARRLLARHAEYLGWGFANIQHAYSPDVIVVGGGVASALDLMLPDIEKVLSANLLASYAPARVIPASLGDDAGVIGASQIAKGLRQAEGAGW